MLDLGSIVFNLSLYFISVYFENARSTTTSTVAFTIVTGGTWKIKITQIECSSYSRAYPDCDQYVTGATGTISSYNWANVQLRAKDYQHCIRREEGIKIFLFHSASRQLFSQKAITNCIYEHNIIYFLPLNSIENIF